MPSLIRVLALGLACIVVMTLVGPMTRLLGVQGGLVVVVMIFAVPPLAWVGLIAFVGVADRRAWLAILSILVMITPPFLSLRLIDTSLLGPVVRTSVADAPNAPWASGFRFTDGRLRADLAREETIEIRTRRSGTGYMHFVVAPVVASDWDTMQPVHVWAVNRSRPMREDWREPFAAGVRLLPDITDDDAVHRAEGKLGVTSSPDRVLIQWIEDPLDARRAVWLRLLGIMAAASACWTLLALVAETGRVRQ